MFTSLPQKKGMVDFVPRIDSAVADSMAATRVVPAVTAVPPVGAVAGSGSDAGVNANSGETARRQQMASAADYARVQVRIAQILANMGRGGALSSTRSQVQADTDIEAMLPRSTVIIPLPPTTTESIERAVKLARDMVRQAELTRGAQANIAPGVVDQLFTRSA